MGARIRLLVVKKLLRVDRVFLLEFLEGENEERRGEKGRRTEDSIIKLCLAR